MTLPELYLIGAPKCGTTSLAGWLAGHPEVYFSVPKEPFYWASDYPRLRAHYGFETRESYEALYSSAPAQRAALRAEGSTVYLYSRSAVPDIVAAVESPRFVLALRNPVDLVVSYHRTQLLALNDDEADFERAWARSVRGDTPATDALDPKLVDYPLVGRLGQAVERLLTHVSREQVHVVLFDDLRTDPGGTWAALTGFLGLPAQPQPAFDRLNASTKTYRSAVLRRLTHRPPSVLSAPVNRLRQWSRTTPNRLVAAAKAQMWRAEAAPTVSPAVRAEVADYLASDTTLLGRLLGRDLTRWVEVGTG